MQMTTDEIRENLEFAAGVMRRLPAIKVQGYFCSWPKFCADEDDMCGSGDMWLSPLPSEITAMEEILEWLTFTEMKYRRIIWLRACKMGWKQIAGRTHRSRSSLIREYNFGLKEIQEALKNEKNIKKRHHYQTVAE